MRFVCETPTVALSVLVLSCISPAREAGAACSYAPVSQNPFGSREQPPLVLTATSMASTNPSNGQRDDRLFAFRRTPTQLEQNVWTSTGVNSGIWSGWRSYTQPPDTMVNTSGCLGSLASWSNWRFDASTGLFWPQFGAVMDFDNTRNLVFDPNRVGFAQTNNLPFVHGWQDFPAPVSSDGDLFRPYTSFVWRQQSTMRVNIFGKGWRNPAGTSLVTLREAFQDGNGWHFTDHGLPDGSSRINLGPNSAVWRDQPERGWVFGTIDGVELAVRKWNDALCPHNWCWERLGMPRDVVRLGTPVAALVNSEPWVFVVGRKSENIPGENWVLYSRRQVLATGLWSDWISWGSPPELYIRGADPCCEDPLTAGFDMTAVMTWRDSSGRARVNLFGTADPIRSTAAGTIATHRGGHLLQFVLDVDGLWKWLPTVQLRETRCIQFTNRNLTCDFPTWVQVSAATVVRARQAPYWQRLSVLLNDEFGRSWEVLSYGTVWVLREIL